VDEGLLEEAAEKLNEDFAKFIRRGIPFTTIKVAMSLDGKIAAWNGDSKWISSPASRRYAHRLRRRCDAVAVGRETVTRDDPLLTARLDDMDEKAPWRIVITKSMKVPLESKLFMPPYGDRTIVATVKSARSAAVARLEDRGVTVIKCRESRGGVSIRDLWRKLAELGIVSMLVEGGGETAASVLEAGVADKFVAFIAPKILGGRSAPTPVEGRGVERIRDAYALSGLTIKRFDSDLMVEGYLV
jgi:diaminohydroxyphosphoribosylaminopyrimidine deaminase/5-amino-6-(5-phosphoribosylamino)uracil reductase